ncbi:V-type proton ATPase subunit C-like [Triticum dicoccoides]|uniref:V-type proton ATPase subunit C-like n=1 Tax=Triticum dicoccoides TaxID=85692 RepID=UPI00188EF836|nr:V-type proton ATPase subunit C-like [Triticum dicoccoides]
MATRYLILSLPTGEEDAGASKYADSFWDELHRSLSGLHVPLYRLNVPKFRRTTLHVLDGVADSLTNLNAEVQDLCNTIHQYIMEIGSVSASKQKSTAVTIGGLSVDDYISMFLWDEKKYCLESPIKDLVSIINSEISNVKSDMKVKRAKYDDVQRKLRAVNRKQGVVSLKEIDFYGFLQPEDMVFSEHLVTLLVIVPITSQKEWLSTYEFLDPLVVPRSTKKIYEDQESALYTITLFAKAVPNFKDRAWKKHFQVSDFMFSPEAYERRKQGIQELVHDQEVTKASLLQWLYGSYSEVFSRWMHVVTMLVFSESRLRYGPHAGFLSVVLVPSMDNEGKIRNALEELTGGGKSYWNSADSEDAFALMGLVGQTDPYHYVSFSIKVV